MLRETLSVISTSLVEIWCITINHCLSFPTIWQYYSELIRLILAAAATAVVSNAAVYQS